MAKWNVGIVGYGWVAGAHIEALNHIPDVQVSAICSSRKLDARELSTKHGGKIAVFNDYDKMLASKDVNVVSVCSYHRDHPKQVIAAAQAGRHIIIEKPVALTLKDARAMMRAVKKAGVKTCVCFEVRYSRQFTVTKSLIDQGLLGKLHLGEADYYHGIGPKYGQYRWNIKKGWGGSSLLTAGCHALDGLLMFMNDEVEEVSSYATKSSHPDYAAYEYPTSSLTIMKFKGGAIGKVASSIDAIQPYYLRVHLFGSEGSLLDGRIFSNKIKGLNDDRWTELGVKLESSGDVSEHPYAAQFIAFFEALDKGRDMALTSLKESLYTHEVIFAADRSAELGRPVKMSELG